MNNGVLLAFIAALCTWALTAIGAALVFFFKGFNKRLLNTMLGFAAGVMIAAAFWSLLAPAIKMAQGGPVPPWLVVSIGFACGAALILLIDRIMPHMHFVSKDNTAEGLPSNLKRSILLFLSITMHNIPEGLAIGVAFGAASLGMYGITITSAIAVAIGIGIQNLPEGAAVSIPLRCEGLSRTKSFMFGQLSAIVEPIAAVIGAALVIRMQAILPYALSFAAGAMIYVVVEQLIPEAQAGNHKSTDLATIGCILGFIVMMILEVALV